jgi:hypothetical protein
MPFSGEEESIPLVYGRQFEMVNKHFVPKATVANSRFQATNMAK